MLILPNGGLTCGDIDNTPLDARKSRTTKTTQLTIKVKCVSILSGELEKSREWRIFETRPIAEDAAHCGRSCAWSLGLLTDFALYREVLRMDRGRELQELHYLPVPISNDALGWLSLRRGVHGTPVHVRVLDEIPACPPTGLPSFRQTCDICGRHRPAKCLGRRFNLLSNLP